MSYDQRLKIPIIDTILITDGGIFGLLYAPNFLDLINYINILVVCIENTLLNRFMKQAT